MGAKEFAAQIQVLDIPNEIKVGYSPIGFVRCGRAACRISKLTWKMGKETGGKKIGGPALIEVKRDGRSLLRPSFAFAFYMDRQKEERERGVTIACGDAGQGHLMRADRCG